MLFITLEGGEGSGKTTQLTALGQCLKSSHIDVLVTCEPGGTPLGKEIRKLLLENEIVDPKTEFALFTAARRDHVLNVIRPALAKGQVVLCDRYIDSSLVYQGLAKGLSLELMLNIHKELVGDLMPDITFLLDAEPSDAERRVKHDIASDLRSQNHYDLKPIEFYKQINQHFLHLAKRFSDRIVVIDANQESGEVTKTILQRISAQLSVVRLKSEA